MSIPQARPLPPMSSQASRRVSPRPGRRLTVASYVCTLFSFMAPAALAGVAIVLGVAAASQGDRAGRTAAVVAGVVLALEITFFVLWAFGVIRLPL